MTRILLASELGGGAGHVMRLKPIAEALRRMGASVVFAVRDIVSARPLTAEGFDVLPAPRITEGLNTGLFAANYAEILMRAGFERRDHVLIQAAAWRDFLSLLSPDLVVADFAPGAMMGAAIMRLQRASVGTGFALPPDVTPLPNFAPWLNAPADRLAAAEQNVLAAINAALAHYGCRPFDRLAQLANTGCDVLCTVADLDHYPSRSGNPTYVGPIYDSPVDRPPVWPERGRPRVFAYLNGEWPALPGTLQALTTLSAGTLLVVQGAVDPAAIATQAANIKVSTMPVDLRQTLPQVRLVVCHAGMGTVSQALKAGLPLLLLPRNPEQIGTALRVAAMGAGIVLRGTVKHDELIAALDRGLNDGALAEGARTAARRFAASTREAAITAAAKAILARATS